MDSVILPMCVGGHPSVKIERVFLRLEAPLPPLVGPPEQVVPDNGAGSQGP